MGTKTSDRHSFKGVIMQTSPFVHARMKIPVNRDIDHSIRVIYIGVIMSEALPRHDDETG